MFEPKDPLALKVVYWVNIILLVFLTIAGFSFAYTFILWLPLITLALAYLFYRFFISALKQKKKYSYWLNIGFHSLVLIYFIVNLFFRSIELSDLFRLLNVVALYFLLTKEMRVLFIAPVTKLSRRKKLA
ncbi:hypothetical protein HY494_03195 [Candidatus Woesearchaeota archaeon]|nr:hypothetical protein [Candidatus Woesearchaeota archaeon]